MDQPGAVGAVERRGDLNRTGKGLVACEGALLEPRRQRLALEVLHDQEVDAGAVAVGRLAADIVQGADVGVIQRRHRACFALEAFPGLRVAGDVRRQHLQGHGAGQPCIARPVDLAHPSGAQRRDDFVGTKPGSGRQGHECHLSGKRRLTAGL